VIFLSWIWPVRAIIIFSADAEVLRFGGRKSAVYKDILSPFVARITSAFPTIHGSVSSPQVLAKLAAGLKNSDRHKYHFRVLLDLQNSVSRELSETGILQVPRRSWCPCRSAEPGIVSLRNSSLRGAARQRVQSVRRPEEIVVAGQQSGRLRFDADDHPQARADRGAHQ
jgi:hypothetical protein